MRIVSGRRDLDDYHGLPGARGAVGKAKLVSLLMMTAISLGASFSALALVKEALNRTLGADTVNRALRELDPADADLFSFIDPKFSIDAEPRNFAAASWQELGRRTFGQRKTPPPAPATSLVLTTFTPEYGHGFAPSTAPRHAETNGFVEAPRLGSSSKIQVVGPLPQSL